MLAKIGKRWEMKLFDLGTSQTFTPGVQYTMLIKVLAGTASPQLAPIGAAASKIIRESSNKHLQHML